MYIDVGANIKTNIEANTNTNITGPWQAERDTEFEQMKLTLKQTLKQAMDYIYILKH